MKHFNVWELSLVDPSLWHTSWSDLDSIKASLSSWPTSGLKPTLLQSISVSLLSAFLSSVDNTHDHCGLLFTKCYGRPYESSTVLENSLVMDIPIPTVLHSHHSTSTNIISSIARTAQSRQTITTTKETGLVVTLFEY